MTLPVFEAHAWDWDECPERFPVTRGPRTMSTLPGAYDPEKERLYLGACADVVAGDVVTVRGQLRRVVDVPEVWRGAGTVVQLAELPAFLDVAQLIRPGAGSGGWDYELDRYVEATDLVLWSGPCTITAVDQGGDATANAEQMVTVQAFDVEIPVEVVDVRPDDVIRASSSADARLVGRRLVITRIQAGSAAASRTFRAIDNQG